MKTIIIGLVMTAVATHAVEYHVAKHGSDNHPGSATEPFKTISKGAAAAQPGDTVTVHEGIYREEINPPRGGTSEEQRIVYQAAAGDWFKPQGRVHHTGEVYLDGTAMAEEVEWPRLLAKPMTWLCATDETTTTLNANFGGADPSAGLVEINVRPTVFYPDTPGRDYITVRGFTLRHTASQWAPPTAEQKALIGTHWSKGWIIENNVISDSKCVGLTLGKYGDQYDNTSADTADGYVKTIERAGDNGWSKANIGSHIVRNNIIHGCGAAGICGSLGAIFSEITGNHLYDINIGKPWTGHEMAGIKFHAPIDMLIKDNRIHHTSRGIWLDWMTQGTRVTGNLLYDNGRQDIYIEVNHGPFVVDNNIFMTPGFSLKDVSQGGAYIHNLLPGEVKTYANQRRTPYHKEHSTEIAGLSDIQGGDNRFFNNVFAAPEALAAYPDWMPPNQAEGNLFPAAGNRPKLIEEGDEVFVKLTFPAAEKLKTGIITSDDLGKTAISGLPYRNHDGKPLMLNRDFFDTIRKTDAPSAGPFENIGSEQVTLKVWPKPPQGNDT